MLLNIQNTDSNELLQSRNSKKVSQKLDEGILQSASSQIKDPVQSTRELFQNFVDASKESSIKSFSYESYKTFHNTLIHEFKDLGRGMSLKQLINLFVPYSGNKEKGIGEFGWGASTMVELAGANSRISILSKEKDKPACRVSFGIGYKNQPVKLLEISKISDTSDIFPTDHGTLIIIEQNTDYSLPELYFAKIDSALKHYALGTVSTNPEIDLKIQGKSAFNSNDLNVEILLPKQAKTVKIDEKELSLQVSKTKGSDIILSVKNIPICNLKI